MSQDFQAGDFLIFQVEAGFGLLRLLDIDRGETATIWHLAAYEDMFPDSDFADQAIENGSNFKTSHAHLALTTRAFESTQTARMGNRDLTDEEIEPLMRWRESQNRDVSDRSVRLLLGLR